MHYDNYLIEFNITFFLGSGNGEFVHLSGSVSCDTCFRGEIPGRGLQDSHICQSKFNGILAKQQVRISTWIGTD